MAVTRSTAAGRRSATPPLIIRRHELIALLLVSLVTIVGLTLAYNATTQPSPALNLNTLTAPEQLLPILQPLFPAPAERLAIATKIFQATETKLPNVGSIGRLRILPQRDVAALKPSLAVRTQSEYRRSFLLWTAAYLLAFYALHAFWTWHRGAINQTILPLIHLLTGIGLIQMTSLRDPLRDTLAMSDFAQAVVIGAFGMALMSSLDIPRLAAKLSYIPLLAALLLSSLLVLFGTGPGTSDAKVNLLGFQPAEAIKILLVFFLAGYFAHRWELLRTLVETRPELAKYKVPRLEYLLPVLLSVALTLLFFFLQKDLGPALVWSGLFLAMYSVARARAVLALAGIALLILGFTVGYWIHYPTTVHTRVQMWMSPWDNSVRGGEQVVHSLWGLSTGGTFGTGIGLGDPEIMPAAHTDLILAAVGEEWGFIGLLGVYLLYAALLWTGLRIAMHSPTDYGFFLALGCTLLIALETFLISGGVLGLTPLSGVVTPFLSYGGTAMLANFVLFGILLSLSRENIEGDHTEPFRVPVIRLAQLAGVAMLLIVGKAAYLQVLRADPTVGAGTLTVQADGMRRYQYNPRLMAIARGIPRGNILDAAGRPLATSDWKELKKSEGAFRQMGIAIPPVDDPREFRYYPLGAYTVHLLGDLHTRANWGARNSSLVEREAVVQLQGYDDRARVIAVDKHYTVRHDYRELVPLLRHRWQPDHPLVLKVLNRNRDVKMTIDSRLQVRASRILQTHLKRLGKQKGSLVAMDTSTGDLLASVSYPWPEQMPPVLGPDDGVDELLDRARYGLYPPGSTFKIVTAIAALRADPTSAQVTYDCKNLPDGRVGNYIKGSTRPIRDDVADRTAHGSVDMRKGTAISCNAYYAQLGTYKVKAAALRETASLLGIATGELKQSLPQAAYGQGEVVASPFQLARVAATVANNGAMPLGRWILGSGNTRQEAPQQILPPDRAVLLGTFMRAVVTGGTGRGVAAIVPAIAGKTGTAELEKKASHAWFIGYAPYGGERKIAFSVLVENGQYGGSAAAPIAADLVKAAAELGLLR